MPAITFKLFKKRESNKIEITGNENLVFSKKWDIVSVKLTEINAKSELKKIKSEYNLYNLSGTQSRLKYLLLNSSKMDIVILGINFFNDIDDEDQVEIDKLLKNNDLDNLSIFIDELFEAGYEISSLIMELGKNYSDFSNTSIIINRNGKIEATVSKKAKIEFSDLFSEDFIGVLSGEWKK